MGARLAQKGARFNLWVKQSGGVDFSAATRAHCPGNKNLAVQAVTLLRVEAAFVV